MNDDERHELRIKNEINNLQKVNLLVKKISYYWKCPDCESEVNYDGYRREGEEVEILTYCADD